MELEERVAQRTDEIRRLNLELERRVVERTAELEEANKELQAFTYSVSHDLRGPLRHIEGFAALLLEECGAELSGQARGHAARIRESGRTMTAMVNDLLNLSRVGRAELDLQLTGLNSLVEEVRHDLEPELEGRTVEWQVEDLPFVECDPVLMKQVFANLLSNAVKFTRLREKALIEVGTRSEDSLPVVLVRDNGVGFSMKYADKLFGVFQRLHRAEDFPGTGVGLATVRRIIHKHGGRIWAEAELNKGATFYFTLGVPEGREMESPSANGGVECAKTK
jgi:light-regulated signal transduction histidine kinase (bacteriophytochrome)